MKRYFVIIVFIFCAAVYHADAKQKKHSEEKSSVNEREQDLKWFIGEHEDMLNKYFKGKFGVDKHSTGWDTGAYLRAYIDMYEASHNIQILRNLNQLLKIVADGNDILTHRIDDRTGKVMPGWGTRDGFGPKKRSRYSEMLADALHAYPLAAFARIVKEDPALAKEFGKDADRYYKLVADLYEQHKPFVKDEDSPYPDGTEGLYFQYPDNYYESKKNYSGIEAPINLTVIIAEPLIELYRASVADGHPDDSFQKIVIKVGNYVRWNTRVVDSTNKKERYLVWYYWPADTNRNSRTRMEDINHSARIGQFAVSMYNAGLRNQWNKERLEYLANTFTHGAVIGDNKFANYIDGTAGKYNDDAATLYEWLELEPYSHSSSTEGIGECIKEAMRKEGDDNKYNFAVFAKFYRFFHQ